MHTSRHGNGRLREANWLCRAAKYKYRANASVIVFFLLLFFVSSCAALRIKEELEFSYPSGSIIVFMEDSVPIKATVIGYNKNGTMRVQTPSTCTNISPYEIINVVSRGE